MKKALMIISGTVTAVICLVMNFILIPKIEAGCDGIRCFDMNFGYDYETAKRFLALISNEGRQIYLHVQLPLDFVYPIAYCLFFSLVLLALSRGKKALIAVPVLLAVFDYIENICTIIMLNSAELSELLAKFASAATAIKTVLMYAVFVMIIVCLVYYFKTKKAQKL